MSSRHAFLIAAAPFGIGVHADWFARHDSDTAPAPLGQTQAAVHRVFSLIGHGQLVLQDVLALEERCRERARLLRELQDVLPRGSPGASMLPHRAMQSTHADSPLELALRRALRLVRRAIAESRATAQGLRVSPPEAATLERALALFLGEVLPAPGVRIRTFVQGKPRLVKPAIQEQLLLIGREAVNNALHHARATRIEVEVQYLRTRLCVLVRDNGCGLSSEEIQKGGDSRWGLHAMRERAENIGARFTVWSRPGSGTEVRVVVPAVVVTASS